MVAKYKRPTRLIYPEAAKCENHPLSYDLQAKAASDWGIVDQVSVLIYRKNAWFSASSVL